MKETQGGGRQRGQGVEVREPCDVCSLHFSGNRHYCKIEEGLLSSHCEEHHSILDR